MSILQDVNRAMDHHRHGRLVQAEAEYRNILARDPKNFDALHLLGTIVSGKGQSREGIELILRALARMPNSPEAHFNLGNIYAGLYRFAEAEPHFRAAFRLNPRNAEAANGVGGALLRLGRYEEAEQWLKKALVVDPQCVGALINSGTLMDAVGRFSETIAYYDRAIALSPQRADVHHFKALALLARRQFSEGWREFAWRFKDNPSLKKHFSLPFWQGEPLAGRNILVWTEQGLGDEVLIASMIPDLIAAGAKVVLLASPRLRTVFARSFPAVEVLPFNGKASAAEIPADAAFQASLSDLGRHLRPSLSAFAAPRKYLTADASLAHSLREKYLAGRETNLLVGISWRSKAPESGAEKTVPLEHWTPVLSVPGVTFVNLQYGDTTAEVTAAESATGACIITDRDVDALGDMMPFAAQIAATDLVVTVSNTTAHIAGALGAKACVLVPANSGRLWYWFLEGSDSPWYPHVRLLRQPVAGWTSTMKEVASMISSRRRDAQ
ncbi:MAG: tetratricopeptide repeat protein [Rhodospirillaceae bacterium]